jgi:branched-chain amino acid transport system ATP-binding protein
VFPDLTVLENLRVGSYLSHRSRASFADATALVLELVPRLRDRLDVKAGVLSGGEQRHLAVAQTLYRRPAVLLADELALGLDAASQADVLHLLRTLADDGIGVLVVDHDLDALSRIADRTLAVDDGSVIEAEGPAATVGKGDGLAPARFLTSSAR